MEAGGGLSPLFDEMEERVKESVKEVAIRKMEQVKGKMVRADRLVSNSSGLFHMQNLSGFQPHSII